MNYTGENVDVVSGICEEDERQIILVEKKNVNHTAKEPLTWMGLVFGSCNPSIQKLKLEDLQFQASLGYSMRPCLKTKVLPGCF
jgi:hypothetical protein